jgi:signal transduction histidine kinase
MSPSRRFVTTRVTSSATPSSRAPTKINRVTAGETASQQRDEILEAERSARMAAQRATRVKDEFLATLSHELRTPLSAILGWTQVLLKAGTENEPARQRRAIEVIDRNARAQVQLIDDLPGHEQDHDWQDPARPSQVSRHGRRGRRRLSQTSGRCQGTFD